MPQKPFNRPIDSAMVARFAEPATFNRLPWVKDFSGLDIAIAGVPFDLGCTFRKGAALGPAGIREASRFIRLVNHATGIAPYDLCNVADVGDVPINPIDLMDSIGRIEDFFRRLHHAGAVPIAVGGDHTIPLPIFRAIVDRKQPVGVVHFDAHADTLDELLGSKINHATPFRRAVEEGLIDPRRMVQIGLRGSRYSDQDINYGIEVGMRVIDIEEYESLGREKVIKEIRRVIGSGPTYVTIDIDGLDPVYAIGTGVPEPGGLSMRDMQVMLRFLDGADLIGGDVCEVAPEFDPTNHTCVNAANLVFEMLCVISRSVARKKGRK
jgi:guanidinopropionase